MEALKKTSIHGEMTTCLSGNYIEQLKEIQRGFGLDLISGGATVSFAGDLET